VYVTHNISFSSHFCLFPSLVPDAFHACFTSSIPNSLRLLIAALRHSEFLSMLLAILFISYPFFPILTHTTFITTFGGLSSARRLAARISNECGKSSEIDKTIEALAGSILKLFWIAKNDDHC
jgi:hypothetical protein